MAMHLMYMYIDRLLLSRRAEPTKCECHTQQHYVILKLISDSRSSANYSVDNVVQTLL